MIRLAVAAALLGLGSATAASEEQDDPAGYARSGVYLTVTGNWQLENYRGTNGFAPDSSGGVAGRIGYRFHPNVAVEVHTEWVKDALEDEFNESAFVVTANVKGYLAKPGKEQWQRLQPFLLLGSGFMRAPVPQKSDRSSDLENGMAFRFGGGMDVWATEHWALFLEASYLQPLPINELDKVPFASLGGGFQLRF